MTAALRIPAASLSLCVCLAAGAGCRGNGAAPFVADAAYVAAVNDAAGQMGRYDFQAAVDRFAALAAAHPDAAETSYNLAVALLNRQRPDDAAEAERRLRALTDHAVLATRARYTLGLLLLYQGRDADAYPLLSTVARAMPRDPYPAYFAGQARLSASPAEALTWFDAASAGDPLLRSAHYGAFQALQRTGQTAAAETRLAEFQALERDPRARLAEFKYSRMGPLAEVVFVEADETPAPAPSGSRFAAPAVRVGLRGVPPAISHHAPALTVADIDGDGALDVFVSDAGTGPTPNLVVRRTGAGWTPVDGHPLAGVDDVRAALWGDLDDDGLTDVVLARGRGRTALWRQSPAGIWRDVTATARAGTASVDAVDGALVDADHDGDLDVFLVNARGPNELLNNNGNGTFRRIAAEAGVAGDGRPSLGVAIADLDGDRDHDIVVLKATPPHAVYLNDRVWRYRAHPDASAFTAADIDAVLAADLDADGRPELYAAGGAGLQRWTVDERHVRHDQVLVAGPRAGVRPRLATADTDGDGRFEIMTTHGATWAAVDTRGKAAVVADGGTALVSWTVAAFDPARGPSVVGLGATGLVEWAAGEGRHPFLAIATTGRSQASDQRRSNVAGVGTRVHVRTGSRWTAFDTARQQSGPGQSLQPTPIGLGGARRADLVALTWSDGVLQTELHLDAGRLHVIEETQRQLSSCPVLFAFDGTATRFVTDLLGVGGLGFFERPGVYSTPFPQESVLLPGAALGTTPDGRLRLHIGEPMEEVAYLDRLELVAYDVPPGWQMALDERKAIASAPPSGAPVFYAHERRPVRVVNDRGHDVTDAVARVDHRAAPPGAADPRFIGLTTRHALELVFDVPIDRGPGRPTLVADGWVEYPYAQTVFAAWQAGAPIEAPTLEARGSDGRWRVVAPQFGYPAGMPRRMTLPLPPLPPGTTALRLTTTQEIYWDRLSVAYAAPAPGVAARPLALATATLREAGFARRTTGPQRTPFYDYDRRTPLWDTRHPRGWYTRFGDVRPLVADADDATVILGPGEEVVVEFEAPPDPPPGWTRHYVVAARGWCKDMDLYTQDGETVTPLPGRDTATRRALHAQFATRYEGGQ
jgi:hypothetical protein